MDITRITSRDDQPGTRLLYWVRGSFRVRDNLALSVAMWLSRELRMPLQALAFVDPAVGRTTASRYVSADEHDVKQQGASLVECGQTMAPLPFRMAVESSALCEMEQALRVIGDFCGHCALLLLQKKTHGQLEFCTRSPV